MKILSTTQLDQSLIDKVLANGMEIDAIDFIKTVAVANEEVKKKCIKTLQKNESTFVFTSANAVRAIGMLNEGNATIKIYCIGQATKKAVEQYFDKTLIVGSANNAAELAQLIIATGTETITFFCGNQRLDTLPNSLRNAGIEVNEIVVYETIPTPIEIKKHYDAILFFSPSCVSSFFAQNNVLPQTQLFAIGNTTAKALGGYTNNTILISKIPSKEQVLEDVIAYFSKKIVTSHIYHLKKEIKP